MPGPAPRSRHKVAIAILLAISLFLAGAYTVHHLKAPRGLTTESLKNISYETDDDGAPMRMSGGRYIAPVTWNERVETFTNWLKGGDFGPFDYDSREELQFVSSVTGSIRGRPVAAVTYFESSGGTGRGYKLGIVIERDGDAECTGVLVLGDRPQVESVSFDSNTVIIDLIRAGPRDSPNAPTEHVLLYCELDEAWRPKIVSIKNLQKIEYGNGEIATEASKEAHELKETSDGKDE